MSQEHLTDEQYFTRATRMQFIGVTEESFKYQHSDGNKYESKFEFYWNTSSGAIDVCHFGCNGTIFMGRTNEEGSVAFPRIPYGYPAEAVFTEAFKKLQEEFLAKQQ